MQCMTIALHHDVSLRQGYVLSSSYCIVALLRVRSVVLPSFQVRFHRRAVFFVMATVSGTVTTQSYYKASLLRPQTVFTDPGPKDAEPRTRVHVGQ